jgi:ABC-type Mn2+/Zn2+ transport system ATPase subunit
LRGCWEGGRPAAGRMGSESASPPAVFLSEIAVEGFRGVGSRARLGLRPGPGLTLVVGRNGSAKSTFSEGAELALTGTSSRWEGKGARVWEEGWANLHHAGPRVVEVRLVEEGQQGTTMVAREWPAGADLREGACFVQRPGQRREGLASLGLSEALVTWRPFLSYNELGGLLEEGPSKLYDAISKVLGLEEWVEVGAVLDRARKQLEERAKAVATDAAGLKAVLGEVDDERAARALAALPAGRKVGDLPALESLATGEGPPTETSAVLEVLAGLAVPGAEDVEGRAGRLREALAQMEAVGATDAGRARQLAVLLEQALAFYEHGQDGRCPVCGTEGILGPEWEARTRGEVTRLREEGRAADREHGELAAAVQAARDLLAPAPDLTTAPAVGLDPVATGELTRRWAAWRAAPDDSGELADHLERELGSLREAAEQVREAAQAERRRRQDLWQPVAAQLAAWLPGAKAAQEDASCLASIKKAIGWVREEIDRLRDERFAPIAERVQQIWQQLSQSSSVALDGVTLEGTKTRRRVRLAVSVDQVAGAALSVMSQGELHALALSLFLPRATLKESPFRFLVIDDPVQAMDAARVDGLARVLDEVARTHQVVVLTHDERLPDAVRRLGIGGTVLEVSRGLRSEVTVRVRRDPVSDSLEDARSVLNTDGYPQEALRRVVPGLCRRAVEAACDDLIRRRLLARGVAHADIEQQLEGASKLLPRLALALFGDAGRAGEVMGEVNRRWGRGAGDCARDLNRGSHQAIDADGLVFIEAAERLARGILDLA